MSVNWALVDNPEWAGQTPPAEPFRESGCHDRSHFLTIVCRCGTAMHLHETALGAVPQGAGVVTRCKGCQAELTFQPGSLSRAFAELRRRGWIA